MNWKASGCLAGVVGADVGPVRGRPVCKRRVQQTGDVADQLRRRQLVRFAPLEEGLEVADEAPGPEARYASRQRQVQLERALRRLAAEHREILLLREVEGLAYGELASVLGIAEGTVKSRLARARSALLEHFDPHTGASHE